MEDALGFGGGGRGGQHGSESEPAVAKDDARSAAKAACEVCRQTGSPFDGRLLRAGNLVVWAAIASRDGDQEDPVALLQQVLGCGSVGMEEILVGDGDE